MGEGKLSDVNHESAEAMLRALKPPRVEHERLRELTERRRLGLHVSRAELCDGVDGLLLEIASLQRDLAELREAARVAIDAWMDDATSLDAAMQSLLRACFAADAATERLNARRQAVPAEPPKAPEPSESIAERNAITVGDLVGLRRVEKRNMYDCTPCPKCGEPYRAAYGPQHPRHPECVACDDCGHIEPKDGVNYKPAEPPKEASGLEAIAARVQSETVASMASLYESERRRREGGSDGK